MTLTEMLAKWPKCSIDGRRKDPDKVCDTCAYRGHLSPERNICFYDGGRKKRGKK